MARADVLAALRARGLAYWRFAEPLTAWSALGMFSALQLVLDLKRMAAQLPDLSPAALRLPDPSCGNPHCDFSTFWLAGALARAGRFDAIYDASQFDALRRATYFPQISDLPWFYPPPALLAVAPVSALPFGPGFYVWSACLLLATAALLRTARLPWLVVAAGMLSPAAIACFELGQFGALIGALTVAGLLLAPDAPVLAGVILALLALKPQAGLLAPLALPASRRWRAVLAFGIAGALVLALTTLVFGWSAWRSYFSAGMPVVKAVLYARPATSGYEKFGVSVFWMLRSFGAPPFSAWAAQALAAAAAAALAWLVWRRPGTAIERMALTVFLSLLATPYGYCDDMVGWSVALAALAAARGWRIGLADALFWCWPMFCPVCFGLTGLELTPLVVAAAVARTWWRTAPVLPRREAVLTGA